MVSVEDYGNYETAWCPGCGNFSILQAVKQALAAGNLKPHEVLFVSGIGQAAKAPHYLNANLFDGLHGRSLPVATGAKLANPRLTVIVDSGDGCNYGEGGNHRYQRFALTENGISPRVLPGATEHLVVADSDEHTEDGHITEDLSVRKQMVEKRLRKGAGIRAEAVAPDWEGETKANLVLVSWGSTKGAVREAAAHMRAQGEKVAVLHFSQVWPLVPEHFMGHLESAARVVCVEGNAFGQLARLIRRETGFHIRDKVLRYDGLPITPEYIIRELQ